MPTRFRWKHMGEIVLIGDTSTKFFCGPCRFLLVHWLNSWSLLFNMIFKIAKRLFKAGEKKSNLSATLEYVLLAHRNILQCIWGHFERIILKAKKSLEVLRVKKLNFISWPSIFETFKSHQIGYNGSLIPYMIFYFCSVDELAPMPLQRTSSFSSGESSPR
jgi:hypothetical protein